MESACGIQINNCINFTSGTACQHSGAPHRSKWNGCTAYAEQLSRFTVTCTFDDAAAVFANGRLYRYHLYIYVSDDVEAFKQYETSLKGVS